jgi:hypothetical protein
VSAGVPPSGVVTFLFTDIEGSTRRWETDAKAMRAALGEHDEVLRDAIESHGASVQPRGRQLRASRRWGIEPGPVAQSLWRGRVP